jgi:hypothetical protein
LLALRCTCWTIIASYDNESMMIDGEIMLIGVEVLTVKKVSRNFEISTRLSCSFTHHQVKSKYPFETISQLMAKSHPRTVFMATRPENEN